jgi:uncharacterized protein
MGIVIPGGSGQVGTILARAFHGDGHDVVVLSRQPQIRPWRVVEWDGVTLGSWRSEIDQADVVINLAGRSVNCRYSVANRGEILQSRIASTSVVGEAIARAERPPRVWLQASTATIYAHRYDAANDEGSGVLGANESTAPRSWRFSIDVARAWERAFDQAITKRTRNVALRSAMTLSADAGGVFDTLVRLVRHGLGGSAGDGRQFMSWVHCEDFVAAVRWLIDRDAIDGVGNVASPNPLPNSEFMRLLREACGVSFGVPAREWMLEIGAVFMRTETELILKSRRVVPGRLLERGFEFKFPTWSAAARDLCQQWKTMRDAGSRAAWIRPYRPAVAEETREENPGESLPLPSPRYTFIRNPMRCGGRDTRRRPGRVRPTRRHSGVREVIRYQREKRASLVARYFDTAEQPGRERPPLGPGA